MYIEKLEYQSQYLSLHKAFAKLQSLKYNFLIIGVVLWLIFPLYGMILLLIYCQINISIEGGANKSNFLKNLIPLIIFLFTITVFMSSFNSFSDTNTYIEVYKSASSYNGSLLDYMNKIWTEDAMEPLTFALPMYISLLTNGNESWFLLFQSLTINTAFTVFAIWFLPEVYPIVILFNVVSRGYYYQLLYMRQCYSYIFLIPFIYLNNPYLKLPLIYMALISHVSTLQYSIVLLLTYLKKISTILKLRFFILKSRFILLLIAIVVFVSIYYAWNFMISSSAGLSFFKAERISDYAQSADRGIFDTIFFQIYTCGIDFTVLYIFVFTTDAQKIPSKFRNAFENWRMLFYLILLLYGISNLIGFNVRVYYIFGALTGFFYTIPFYSGKLLAKGKNNIYVNIIIYLIIIKILLFIYDTLRYPGINNYLYFWDGNSLNKTIIEYLYFLYSIIIS